VRACQDKNGWGIVFLRLRLLELIIDDLRLTIGLFAWSAHGADSGAVSSISNEFSLRSARSFAALGLMMDG